MNILDSQDRLIKQKYPDYNREKSSIIFEYGNGYECEFIVNINRKGTHRFDARDGVVVYHKRIK